MARICINIERDGTPCIVAEDIDYALRDMGIGTESADSFRLSETIDIIHQDDNCWTVDLYDRRAVAEEQVDSLKQQLEKSTGATVEVEHVADWPPREWAYATREVKY